MKIIYVRQNYVATLAWIEMYYGPNIWVQLGWKLQPHLTKAVTLNRWSLSSAPFQQLIIYSLHSPVSHQIPSISSEGNTVNFVIEFGFEYVRLTVLWEPTKADPGFGLWSWDCTATRWPQHLCDRSRFQVCYSSHFWRFCMLRSCTQNPWSRAFATVKHGYKASWGVWFFFF